LLNLPGYQLLDLIGGNAGPWADSQRNSHRDVWIFAFGHIHVPKYAPDKRYRQGYPRDLTVVREKLRDVPAFPVVVVVGFH
jgi:hypothetical protein